MRTYPSTQALDVLLETELARQAGNLDEWDKATWDRFCELQQFARTATQSEYLWWQLFYDEWNCQRASLLDAGDEVFQTLFSLMYESRLYCDMSWAPTGH